MCSHWHPNKHTGKDIYNLGLKLVQFINTKPVTMLYIQMEHFLEQYKECENVQLVTCNAKENLTL